MDFRKLSFEDPTSEYYEEVPGSFTPEMSPPPGMTLGSELVDFATVYFQNAYISQGDFFTLRTRHFDNRRIKTGMEMEHRVLKVGKLWSKKSLVTEGSIHKDTKMAFRSLSARMIILIGLSIEYWKDSGMDGRIYDFLSGLFRAWIANDTHHSASIIVHARVKMTKICREKFEASKIKSEIPPLSFALGSDGLYYADIYCPFVRNQVIDEKYPLILARLQDFLKDKMRNLFHVDAFSIDPCEGNWCEDLAEAGCSCLHFSSALKSNFLEAINVALNLLDKHYMDRDLTRTGQSIVAMTMGSGVFHTDRTLTKLTKERLAELSIGCDLVSLGPHPMSLAPLFYVEGNEKDIRFPYYMHCCFPFADGKRLINRILSQGPIQRQPQSDPNVIYNLEEAKIAPKFFDSVYSRDFASNRRNDVRNGYHRRRWAHLYPEGIFNDKFMKDNTTLIHGEFHYPFGAPLFPFSGNPWSKPLTMESSTPNWESLIAPATLPLTVDYVPKHDTSENFEVIQNAVELKTGESTADKVRHIIQLRLSNNYQLLSRKVVPKFFSQYASRLPGEVKKDFLSIGFLLERICFTENEIEITSFLEKTTAPIEPILKTRYNYTLIEPYLAYNSVIQSEFTQFKSPRFLGNEINPDELPKLAYMRKVNRLIIFKTDVDASDMLENLLKKIKIDLRPPSFSPQVDFNQVTAKRIKSVEGGSLFFEMSPRVGKSHALLITIGWVAGNSTEIKEIIRQIDLTSGVMKVPEYALGAIHPFVGTPKLNVDFDGRWKKEEIATILIRDHSCVFHSIKQENVILAHRCKRFLLRVGDNSIILVPNMLELFADGEVEAKRDYQDFERAVQEAFKESSLKRNKQTGYSVMPSSV